jgi:hypothetical protein
MDPSHLAAAVQNCPIPLDANCQAILNGYKEGLQVGQSLTTTLQVKLRQFLCPGKTLFSFSFSFLYEEREVDSEIPNVPSLFHLNLKGRL